MVVISLGSTCSVAYNAQRLRIRDSAYPFDWVRIVKMSDIIYFFSNQFQDYTKFSLTTKKGDNFPTSIDDDFPIDQNKNSKSLVVTNGKAIFYHDFTINDSFENQVLEIKDKYQRRIDRLYRLLKNDNGTRVHFIRDEHRPKQLTKLILEQLCKIIKEINPHLKFKISVIIHNPKNYKYPIFEEQLPEEIKLYNDIQISKDWKRENLDWKNIFQ